MYQTPYLTQKYRILRIFIHTIAGLILAALVLPWVQKDTKSTLIKWWCSRLLSAFNIQVKVFGQLPSNTAQSVLFVANHVSWSDIHALNSIVALRFISKSDVKNWPVFGYLATQANTLFIVRNKSQTAGKIVDVCSASLRNGDNLCFFPEGTTSDGQQVLQFKSSIIQAAIDANALIWPVAIRYVNIDGSLNTQMAYAGNTTMQQSIVAILNIRCPIVELHFLEPIVTTSQTRRQLTQTAYDAIVLKLDS